MRLIENHLEPSETFHHVEAHDSLTQGNHRDKTATRDEKEITFRNA